MLHNLVPTWIHIQHIDTVPGMLWCVCPSTAKNVKGKLPALSGNLSLQTQAPLRQSLDVLTGLNTAATTAGAAATKSFCWGN